MKYRWWLFGYDTYYPSGGTTDLIGKYETEAQAKHAERYSANHRDYYEIVDVLADSETPLDDQPRGVPLPSKS